MQARTIKTYTAIAAAAAAVSFGAAAAAVTPVGSAGAVGAMAHTSSAPIGGAATPSVASAVIGHLLDDPHGAFDAGDQRVVLCATAIEYGLIA